MMESRKQLFFIFVISLAAVACYVLVRFFNENDEARVRRVVYAAVVGVEKEDVARCSAVVAAAYNDPSGNNKWSLLKYIAEIFREFDDFKVVIKQMKVEFKDSKATADIGFTVYFRKAGESKLYYDSGKLNVDFIREGLRWKVAGVQYSGSNELLFLQGVA